MLHKYIKSNRAYGILFVIFLLIFGILSYLYGLPFDGVIYAGLLSICILLAAGCIGLVKFQEKALRLEEIKENVSMLGQLP